MSDKTLNELKVEAYSTLAGDTSGKTLNDLEREYYVAIIQGGGGGGEGQVISVNGQQGIVTLGAADVNAAPKLPTGLPVGVYVLNQNSQWVLLEDFVTSVNGQVGDVLLSAADVGAAKVLAPSSAAGKYAMQPNGEWVKLDDMAAVSSVNGQTGDVILDADDVGAVIAHPAPQVGHTYVVGDDGKTLIDISTSNDLVTSVNGLKGDVTLDASAVDAAPELPPEAEAGKQYALTDAGWTEIIIPTAAVDSVNGQVGDVTLVASDVDAAPELPAGVEIDKNYVLKGDNTWVENPATSVQSKIATSGNAQSLTITDTGTQHVDSVKGVTINRIIALDKTITDSIPDLSKYVFRRSGAEVYTIAAGTGVVDFKSAPTINGVPMGGVSSVNGETGSVVLDATDVGAAVEISGGVSGKQYSMRSDGAWEESKSVGELLSSDSDGVKVELTGSGVSDAKVKFFPANVAVYSEEYFESPDTNVRNTSGGKIIQRINDTDSFEIDGVTAVVDFKVAPTINGSPIGGGSAGNEITSDDTFSSVKAEDGSSVSINVNAADTVNPEGISATKDSVTVSGSDLAALEPKNLDGLLLKAGSSNIAITSTGIDFSVEPTVNGQPIGGGSSGGIVNGNMLINSPLSKGHLSGSIGSWQDFDGDVDSSSMFMYPSVYPNANFMNNTNASKVSVVDSETGGKGLRLQTLFSGQNVSFGINKDMLADAVSSGTGSIYFSFIAEGNGSIRFSSTSTNIKFGNGSSIINIALTPDRFLIGQTTGGQPIYRYFRSVKASSLQSPAFDALVSSNNSHAQLNIGSASAVATSDVIIHSISVGHYDDDAYDGITSQNVPVSDINISDSFVSNDNVNQMKRDDLYFLVNIDELHSLYLSGEHPIINTNYVKVAMVSDDKTRKGKVKLHVPTSSSDLTEVYGVSVSASIQSDGSNKWLTIPLSVLINLDAAITATTVNKTSQLPFAMCSVSWYINDTIAT